MTDYKQKYPIGSYWRTRGGDKVVVVNVLGNQVLVCHLDRSCSYYASALDGSSFRGNTLSGDSRDLIEPWVEKKCGEFWVNVYNDGDDLHCGGCYLTKEKADFGASIKRIARKKITWVEGQFDE